MAFNYMSYLTGANTNMTERQFFEREIRRWKSSRGRKNQIAGEQYYHGLHDILKRKRTVIGKDGKLSEVDNLPNNRIVDNQYGKMVDQKTNYLFGKRFTFNTENDEYKAALSKIFNKRFHRTLQNLAESSLNGGIGWLYVYYDENREFRFKRFEPYEVLPFWKDAEHTSLDCVVRVYETNVYDGFSLRTVEKAEIYKATGVERFEFVNGSLIKDPVYPSGNYVEVEESAEASGGGANGGAGWNTSGGAGGDNDAGAGGHTGGYNWDRIPIIPFKYNDEEIPLICKVKSIQDGINVMLSDFENNMQEDSRNTILIIKNYDGENLEEFRHNLATFGAVKVKTIDGSEGGVDALQVEVNSENYKVLLELLKKALIENAMGYDAKDDRMSGSPNQMNILSMYSDIDLDANGMETEYQASFEDLLWFINAHLANSGQGDFEGEEVEIIFNRDMLMNETDIINNIRNSVGILSDETLVAQHPWVNDVGAELERLKKESGPEGSDYPNAPPASDNNALVTDRAENA